MLNDLSMMADAAGKPGQGAKWNHAQQAMVHELSELFKKVK